MATTERATHSPVAGGGSFERASSRLGYVDNLRVLVIVLVVTMHVAIIYGGLAEETAGQQDLLSVVATLWFAAVVQAFAMFLMFAISGYLTPGSYDRKGPGVFLGDRLVRLGIPLVIYDGLINPFVVNASRVRPDGLGAALTSFLPNYTASFTGIGTGPVWFLVHLLIFSTAYVLVRRSGRRLPVQVVQPAADRSGHSGARSSPVHQQILAFLAGLALVSFLVRGIVPIGWPNFFNIKAAYLPQYISAFTVGILAYRRGWIAHLTDSAGRTWLLIGFVASLIFPALALLLDYGMMQGGLSVPALIFAVWETTVCVGLTVGLLALFRRRVDRQGPLARTLSANTYGAYLLHVLVIFLLGYIFRGSGLYPLLAFVIVSLITVPACFLVGALTRKIPYADRVL